MSDALIITDKKHQDGDRYKWGAEPAITTTGVFTAEPDGTAFRVGKPYRIWRQRGENGDWIATDFTFKDDGNVVGLPNTVFDGEIPTAEGAGGTLLGGQGQSGGNGSRSASGLNDVAQVGNYTSLPLFVGNIGAPWPVVTGAAYGVVVDPNGVGGQLAIQLLTGATAPPAAVLVIGDDYEIVPASEGTAPNAPTNLHVTYPTSGSYNAVLDFTDNSNNEAEFDFERSTTSADGPFAFLISVGPNVTTQGLIINSYGVDTWYRVTAKNAVGSSTPSNVIAVRIDSPTQTQLVAHYGLYGVGETPAKQADVVDGGTYPIVAGGQNIGVRITDAAGNVPTGAFAGMSLSVIRVYNGEELGFPAMDSNVVPRTDPVFAFIRLTGRDLPAGDYRIKATEYQNGPILKEHAVITITLAATGPVYHAPKWPAPTISQVSGNTGLDRFLSPATDEDPGDSITYTRGALPGGLALDLMTLRLTGNTPSAPGDYPITLTATDSHNLSADTTYTLRVTAPAASNHRPEHPAIANLTGTVGTPFGADLGAWTDPDAGDTVTTEISGLPPGLSIAGTQLTGTPTTAGTYSVAWRGTDNHGDYNVIFFTITISPAAAVNHAPVAPANLPTIVVQVGKVSQWALDRFTDPDAGDTVTHSMSNLPAWATFQAEYNRFDGTTGPTLLINGPTAPGSYPVTYTGTDNHNLPASTSLTITVNPVN